MRIAPRCPHCGRAAVRGDAPPGKGASAQALTCAWCGRPVAMGPAMEWAPVEPDEETGG